MSEPTTDLILRTVRFPRTGNAEKGVSHFISLDDLSSTLCGRKLWPAGKWREFEYLPWGSPVSCKRCIQTSQQHREKRG